MSYSKLNQDLSVLKERWAVAELSVSYKPKVKTGVIIEQSFDAYQVFNHMWDKDLMNIQEQFSCLFLNRQGEVIGYRLITTGNISSCSVDFNLIVACALICRASSIVLAHNHPGGNPTPSENDKKITFGAIDRLEFFDISILDHIIITDGGYFSFVDHCILKQPK